MQKEVKLRVEGMTCGHCENYVKSAIIDLKGIKNAEVSASNKEANISFDDEKVTLEEIVKAINETEVYQVATVQAN